VPRSTVREWLAGTLPGNRGTGSCAGCGGVHPLELPDSYVYLLGMYLGDGCLSAHRRGVFKLRIALDAKYPAVVVECERAMQDAMPRSRTNAVVHEPNGTWVELYSYSKGWPCLFPQHGPGKKHDRPIRLARWQKALVERRPDLLLRGLLHSDGCRFHNTGRGGWSHPRYAFTNMSADIRRIFCAACEQLALHWTASGGRTIYVSRKADVARLDRFVGPKS
jgi:hypothetical protein